MLELRHPAYETPISYATVDDLFEIFNEELSSLYLLSFLLTADSDKAEQCLIAAIGECVEGGGGIFMDWARPWTRQAVLNHAIEMIMPAPERANNVLFISVKQAQMPAEDNPFATILSLDAFERFVFVMSILEGQSDEQCAMLLRCSPRDVMMARVLALKRQSPLDAQAGEFFQS